MKYSRIGIKSVFIFLKKFVFQIFLSRLILVSIIVEKVKNISQMLYKIKKRCLFCKNVQSFVIALH